MKKEEFLAFLSRDPVLLDGATGSSLRAAGMPREAVTELWVDRNPQALLELQRAYVEAGSRILYAPTFQANSVALGKAGWQGDVEKLNARLVSLSREAAQGRALVAGDMATMAGCLDAWDGANFDRMVEGYRRQVAGLLEGGADLIVGETLLYPQEAEAIFTAVQLEAGDVAVLLSFTMDDSGSLFSGRETGPILRELEQAGRRRGLQLRGRLGASSCPGVTAAQICAGTAHLQAQRGKPRHRPLRSGGVPHGPGGIRQTPEGGVLPGRKSPGRLLRHHPGIHPGVDGEFEIRRDNKHE